MKNFIRQRLLEAIKELPYDPKPELKAAGAYSSLSDPSYKTDLNKIKFRIAKAANIASDFKQSNPDDNYFIAPNQGDGFYQVEFRHDGQIKTKHVKPSGDMQQQNGAFQPSDIGTCKTFQNIARYCFVKAGKNNTSIGASPAEDAANKALIIFKNEILDFLGAGSYQDDTAADYAKEKMSPNILAKKDRKDQEMNRPKNQINMDPEQKSDFEKRQEILRAKIAATKARRNKY